MQEKPASHLWKDCFIMREYRNSGFIMVTRAHTAGQDPALTDPALEVAAQALDSRVKVIKVVLTSNLIRVISSNISSLVIRVIRSN